MTRDPGCTVRGFSLAENVSWFLSLSHEACAARNHNVSDIWSRPELCGAFENWRPSPNLGVPPIDAHAVCVICFLGQLAFVKQILAETHCELPFCQDAIRKYAAGSAASVAVRRKLCR